jgi:hypothetical protein
MTAMISLRRLRTRREGSVIAVIVILILSGALSPFTSRIELHAFVPTNLRAAILTSPFDQTHQSITEDAITEIDSEFFGVTRLTKSMKKAMGTIVDADADVDKDQKTAEKHFDVRAFPRASCA